MRDPVPTGYVCSLPDPGAGGLDPAASNDDQHPRGASPVRSAADRGRSPTRSSAFATTATPGPDNCKLHPGGGPKGYHTNSQYRGSSSPSPRRSYTPSPGPSPRVAVVSSTIPTASALKATQRITENCGQQALAPAETQAANATLTRELEQTRQQLMQAHGAQQGGGGGAWWPRF